MITQTHIDQGILIESDVHQFTAFASDLRITGADFRPGNWPAEVQTSLGNKQSLFPISKVVKGGDIKYVRYGQGNGCIQLVVYND